MQKKTQLFTTWQWLTITSVVLSTAVGCVVYAFGNFDEKGSADKVESRIDQRLERIETKIDQLYRILLRRT